MTRTQKTSRPENVIPEVWEIANPKEKKLARLRWEILKPKIDAARESRGIALTCIQQELFECSRGEEIPAMPVRICDPEEKQHRENYFSNSADMLALVARLVKNDEIRKSPDAQKAVKAEWDHHWNIKTWRK